MGEGARIARRNDIYRSSKTEIMLHSALINVMVKAARRAGRSLKRDLGEIENLQVSLKGPANFVSLADKRAEQMLYEDLNKARPGYGFIGEEGGAREGADKSHTWIVDPLDGTTNFLHGIPQFAISIGLRREDTVIAGLIYNPANDELYIAERGKGAFLNDQRLRVAGRRKLNDCVVACGLPHIGRGDHDLSRREMTEIQNKVAGLRRFGAASLDMAFVAAGRLDGYWERNLSSWDMAAGAIIVREAGGIVSCIDGESDPLQDRQRDLRQRIHPCRTGEDFKAAVGGAALRQGTRSCRRTTAAVAWPSATRESRFLASGYLRRLRGSMRDRSGLLSSPAHRKSLRDRRSCCRVSPQDGEDRRDTRRSQFWSDAFRFRLRPIRSTCPPSSGNG